MIINHNIAALNTYRQLSFNGTQTSKNLEKLSSGLRINRAGDDAAGLAISEKMRGQIRGLNQASRNAQDSISLIQTAEGALSETHAILQRMRELAVQSANDTYIDVDRAQIQSEIDQLAREITRIAETTEFNNQKLLDGDFVNKTFHIGSNADQNVTLTINNMDARALKVTAMTLNTVELVSDNLEGTNITTSNVTFKITVTTGATSVVGTPGVTISLSGSASSGYTINVIAKATSAATVADYNTIANLLNNDENVKAIVTFNGLSTAAATALNSQALTAATIAEADSKNGLGIKVDTQQAANIAITVINNAIDTVSQERSKLGAMQNRLEHTIKNLDTSAENLQASESRIRDVDMAKEMMEFTKNNILQQAAQAMLAQANQVPQGVLQLLR